MLVCGIMIKGRLLILRGRFCNFDIEIYDMDMLCILVTELHRPSLNVTEKSRVTKLVYHLFLPTFPVASRSFKAIVLRLYQNIA